MTTPGQSNEDMTVRARMLEAAEALGRPAATSTHPMTSDLSIDEELVLHSIGWEPIELVTGSSVVSIPYGVWNWGTGEVTDASQGLSQAFAAASSRLHAECAKAGGHGVVGVRVDQSVERNHADVFLAGTAIRPVGAKPVPAQSVFVSDLSGRDFALLDTAGWLPLGLCAGASFAYAPRRAMGVAMRQSSQNVELTNFTQAMYHAREAAMERMQSSAQALGATGVVEVKITEGPMAFATHVVGFVAYGTAVRVGQDGHKRSAPMMVLPLDDPIALFDAASLRGS